MHNFPTGLTRLSRPHPPEHDRTASLENLQAIAAPAQLTKPLTIPQMQAQAAQLRTLAQNYPAGSPERTQLEGQAQSLENAVATTKTETQATPKRQLSDAAATLQAEISLATGQMPSLGWGTADRAFIINRMGELAKEQNLSVDDILAGRSAYKADTASLGNLQKQADAGTSFEQTALLNMKIVEGLMNKGAGTSAGPVINRWLQAGRKATGDPDVAAFNAALVTVMDEYAKILSGNTTGGQRITDAARSQTEGMLSKIDSPQAIHAVFDRTMRPDMENRISSYQSQLTAIKSRIGKMKPGTSPSAPSNAAPTEGARGMSKSRRPIVFHNGHWEYVQ